MDLWSLLDEEKKEHEKVKKVKKEVEQVADQQPAPVVEDEKQDWRTKTSNSSSN